jgi:hypothetical protein
MKTCIEAKPAIIAICDEYKNETKTKISGCQIDVNSICINVTCEKLIITKIQNGKH